MSKAARSTLVLILLVSSVFRPGDGQDVAQGELRFGVQDYRLRNGLRVILSEDRLLPLVTVAVAYGAGTLREKPGQEGLAYLLENLMFQGSENVSPLQHIGFIQKVGGNLNATTTPDKALFYETLPSNYLSLALWLESDRMKSLIITPAAIERTRSDLISEHQDRLASDPYLASFIQFDTLLFPDALYGHPLIATGEGMSALTEADILAFHRAHYIPNNAVLCIVGNIDAARTRELVAKYFETIPPGDDLPPPPRPAFQAEGGAVVQSAALSVPGAGFHMGFRFYPVQTGDACTMRILEYLLLEGETSRLRNRLLRKDLTARYVSGGLEERGGVSALKIFCLNNNPVMVERSERAILSEIDKLRTNLISQEELNRAKRRLKLDFLSRLSTSQGKALSLVNAVFAGTDPKAMGEEMNNCLRVGPPTLQTFVIRNFLPQNRAVLELGPK